MSMIQGNTDWDGIYNAFPVNKEYIWLNNCGTTPASRFVLEEMRVYLTEYAGHSILAPHYGFLKVKAEIQEILGRLLHTRPENIALMHNTAEGLNLISHGMSLKPGDEILLMAAEYPSNVYPWQHWHRKGVKLTTLPEAFSGEEFLAHLEKTITPQTRVVAISPVHWCTGMVLPVEKISSLCRERDVMLVLDGAQGVGQTALDFDGWKIPVLAFSAWKWLLGPLGLGCLSVEPQLLEALNPVFKGTGSVVDDQRYFPYRDEYKPTAERYMYSTVNYNDWIYFRASLKLLESLGFDVVRERIHELADYLRQVLRKRGLKVFPAPVPSGIVVAEKEGVDSEHLVEALGKKGIIVRERLGSIRLAPHIYNTPEQMEKVGEILAGLF